MLTQDEIDAVIAERYRYSVLSHGEWDYCIQLCWDRLVQLLTRNIDDTIYFLDNECRADQFAWMSDVYDVVAKETKSREFVDALHRLAKKYPEEVKDADLMYMINLAETELQKVSNS